MYNVCIFLLLEGNKYYYVVCVYTYLLFVNVFIKSVVLYLSYRYYVLPDTGIPWCVQAHFSTTLLILNSHTTKITNNALLPRHIACIPN